MHIIINNSSMEPIYEQIVNQIQKAIMREELLENDLLPSVRGLSNELKISALTVKKAYDQLEQEGFVTTVHGKGTYVTGANSEMVNEMKRKEIESEFANIFKKAKEIGYSVNEIREMIDLIMEEL